MDIQQRLCEIFRMVFSNPEISISAETTANDIEGWDSLSHITLITAVEVLFNIKFTNKEIMTLRNVGEMVQTINIKLDKQP